MLYFLYRPQYTASCCVAQRDSYLSDAPWLYQTAADWMLEDWEEE